MTNVTRNKAHVNPHSLTKTPVSSISQAPSPDSSLNAILWHNKEEYAKFIDPDRLKTTSPTPSSNPDRAKQEKEVINEIIAFLATSNITSTNVEEHRTKFFRFIRKAFIHKRCHHPYQRGTFHHVSDPLCINRSAGYIISQLSVDPFQSKDASQGHKDAYNQFLRLKNNLGQCFDWRRTEIIQSLCSLSFRDETPLFPLNSDEKKLMKHVVDLLNKQPAQHNEETVKKYYQSLIELTNQCITQPCSHPYQDQSNPNRSSLKNASMACPQKSLDRVITEIKQPHQDIDLPEVNSRENAMEALSQIHQAGVGIDYKKDIQYKCLCNLNMVQKTPSVSSNHPECQGSSPGNIYSSDGKPSTQSSALNKYNRRKDSRSTSSRSGNDPSTIQSKILQKPTPVIQPQPTPTQRKTKRTQTSSDRDQPFSKTVNQRKIPKTVNQLKIPKKRDSSSPSNSSHTNLTPVQQQKKSLTPHPNHTPQVSPTPAQPLVAPTPSTANHVRQTSRFSLPSLQALKENLPDLFQKPWFPWALGLSASSADLAVRWGSITACKLSAAAAGGLGVALGANLCGLAMMGLVTACEHPRRAAGFTNNLRKLALVGLPAALGMTCALSLTLPFYMAPWAGAKIGVALAEHVTVTGLAVAYASKMYLSVVPFENIRIVRYNAPRYAPTSLPRSLFWSLGVLGAAAYLGAFFILDPASVSAVMQMETQVSAGLTSAGIASGLANVAYAAKACQLPHRSPVARTAIQLGLMLGLGIPTAVLTAYLLGIAVPALAAMLTGASLAPWTSPLGISLPIMTTLTGLAAQSLGQLGMDLWRRCVPRPTAPVSMQR